LKKLWAIIISFLLLTISISTLVFYRPLISGNIEEPPCFVGVAFGGNTTTEAKLVINRIKEYSNLFILQSGPISTNETATNEICDYAVASGLNIIVYFGDLDPRILAEKNLTWRASWVNSANLRYGEHFLGVYYYDERGGIYLDTDKNAHQWILPPNSTYDSVASGFINGFLNDSGTVALRAHNTPIFCSDYTLYWFDYLSGYDVVLAQVGWNHSLVKDVGLLRGAATLQHKEWGAIITWKNTIPPYLDSGEAIYGQMISAYEAGAKYIVIFNYPYSDGNPYGIMFDEHFEALEKFWNDKWQGKITHGSTVADAVLVLPKNYGYGLRYPEDKIWGFWGPDEKSPQIWSISQELLSRYGYRLDIVYDDPEFPVEGKYQHIFYWNQTLNFG
jgi:hypothetical protein